MFSAGRVLLMPKGAYNPLTTYEMLDIVSYNGSSYIAKGTTTGNLPTDTTYWQLSAYGGQAANIAGNFAELESSSVATATHYVDDIFVDENSQLMKATQTINIGDTIDENVNCTPTTVEALIAYLSSYVDSLDSLNKKIQGAIEIAAQTDLHSLAIGEYYKKQTTFYITNGPTGIDQEPTAIFRLTVEAALDNASQASSPLLLTLRTPGGVVYTQNFDGSAWGSWVEVASAASVSALNTAKQPKTLDTPITVGGVQQTTVEGALGSINQTLTSKVANEIATRAKVGAHNFVSMKLSPYKAQANNYVSIGTQTDSQLAFTTENHNYADVQLAYALPIGNYKASIGEITASDSYTPIINIYFLDSSGQNVKTTVSLTSNQTKDFEIDASVAYILISFLGTQGAATAAIRTVTFNNLMIRLATDESADYEPYAMTNQEITALLPYKTGSIIASEAVTVNSSHVLRFGQVISVHVDFTVGNTAIPAWDTSFLKIPSNILPEGITGTMQNASTVIQSVYDFTNDAAKLGYVTLAMGSTGADKGFFSNRSFAANTRYNIGMVFIVPPTM